MDSTVPPGSPALQTFWSLAVEKGLLSAEIARELEEESKSTQVSPADLSLRKAALDPIQIDIIESLLRPQDWIPGYELQDVLGFGGMGVVYKARQINLDRTIALKTILINRMQDPKSAARFEQEARAVARLQHPHIIQAFDFGRQGGRLYFAMEFVRGEDLQQRITAQGALSEALVWHIAAQTVLGLAYAAHAGVVHRDIKPANLLLDVQARMSCEEDLPTVKIADFGLAFLTDETESRTRLTADNAAVGSPHYIAPEQLQQTQVDFRADIYALGATLFHALSGVPPFAGRNAIQIAMAKVSGAHPRLREIRPDISAETDELVAWMMQPDPAARPGEYRTLLQRIEKLRSRGEQRPVESTLILNRTEFSHETTGGGGTTDDAHPDYTMTIPTPSQKGPGSGIVPRRKRRVVWGVGVVILLVLGGIWGIVGRGNSTQIPVRVQGRTENLFDGMAFHPKCWKIQQGSWRVAEDEERAKVIEGEGTAAIRLLLLDRATGNWLPPTDYNFSLLVNLHRAQTVDISFVNDPRSKSAQVIRVRSGSVELGTQSTPTGEFHPLSKLYVREGRTRFYLQIEKRGEFYLITAEDVQSKPIRIAKPPSEASIVLHSRGEMAAFSDVTLTELVPPPK